LKIWRYVDLAKFVSMVATGTLYFPCATTELTDDPYEGWLPRSHIKALTEKLMRDYLEGMKQTRDAMQSGRHRASFDAEITHPQQKFDVQELLRKVSSKFGVSCWHINEGESAAMWQLYAAAGKGIAIESTRARLEGALQGGGIEVAQVRYMDFDTAESEKDHEPYLYALFTKRKSFAHEQELRAMIPLSRPGIGTAVPCDMDALIA
jgi:Protein of unknown function (DUF2971)